MSSREDWGGARTQMRRRVLQWFPVAKLRYTVKFVGSVVRVHGFRDGMAFLDQLDGIFKEMGSVYGPVLGSLVLCVAGSFNGCRFCGVGHLYAANVHYFRATGRLLSWDEQELPALNKLPFELFLQSILERLAGDEFVEARRVLERLFALRLGQSAQTEEDHVLKRVLDVWNELGECTIGFSYDAEPAEIPPVLLLPTPLKEIRRYREAREAQRHAAGSR